MWDIIAKVFASNEFRAIFILLVALTIGAVLAYFWVKRREEKYLRNRAMQLVQGLIYKKAWLRAHDTLRSEPFNPEYKKLQPIYRLDEMINGMRTIYQAFAMSQRPMDEIQQLVDRLHGIQGEIDEVRAEADRKIQFLERQYKQMEDAVRVRWLALPPPSEAAPQPEAAEPPEDPPFEEELPERPAPRRVSGDPAA